MPGLALILDSGAGPAYPAGLPELWESLLGASARALGGRRTLLPELAAVSLGTGFLANRPQPAGTAGVRLWMEGEIWDRPAARSAAGIWGDAARSDAELCLALYERLGDRFCECLNGQFVIVLYDEPRRRLLVCNDRFAFRPFFWRLRDGQFTGATEIKCVLAADARPARLDPQGLLELVAFGFQLGDRTLFEGVRALPPASRLVIEDGQAKLDRYWRFRYPAQTARAGEAQLAAELASRLRVACARQSGGPGRVGMALSAGLDSRIVAAALAPDHVPCCAYTTGYADSLDALGASLLAAEFGVRHLHLVPRDGYLGDVAPEVVWRSEGCFAFTNATSVQFHERLRPELDIILTGHAGGALSGQTLLPRALSPSMAGLAPADLEQYLLARALSLDPDRLAALAAPRWPELWDQVRAGFRDTVLALGDQARRRGDAVTAWNMENRQARFTHHSAQVDRPDFEVRAPLLDRDVVEFFLTLPHRFRFAQRLYKRTLADHFPRAAAVPWSKTGGPVPGRPLPILAEFYIGGISRQLAGRIPALARRRKDRTRTARVVGAEMRRDGALRASILEPFLSGDAFPDDLLCRAAARRAVEEHWSGERCHWHAIACLSTLALVSRHFLERGLRAPASLEEHSGAAPRRAA